jgi:formylglycine-generating enzyme required for sulfatase activity
MLARVIEYWFFTRWHAIRRRWLQGHEFEIGKYPLTNREYSQFVEATRYQAPPYWKEGAFPHEEATHPVVGITKRDAEAYCKWLSDKTGKRYRLPTEWEWEWAAAGPHGWEYPWGDQFDKDKCNTTESGSEGTTPVGSYVTGKSFCGASDMSGNVWEITLGVLAAEVLSIILTALEVEVLAAVALVAVVLLVAPSIVEESPIVSLVAVMSILVTLAAVSAVPLVDTLSGSEIKSVIRGGAWNTPFDEATCFYRKNAIDAKFAGFRCVKEIGPPGRAPLTGEKVRKA